MFQKDLPALAVGFAATLIGVGLARFAYTPLVPAVIEAEWFPPAQAAYLGAANLLGYLLGAITANHLASRAGAHKVIWIAAMVAILSFLCSAQSAPFAWFFGWRLAAGIAGGVLMVVGPSLALSVTPVERRPRVAGLIFTGIGVGALLSATLIPWLLQVSLAWTWLHLGALCLVAGLASQWGLRHMERPPLAQETGSPTGPKTGLPMAVIVLVIAAYSMDAIGFVPHTVFWVDFIAREAALGQTLAAQQWALFGLGAILGPLVAGLAAQWLGWATSLLLAFLTKGVAVALPLLSVSPFSLAISSFVVGALVPGIVTLTSGRLSELVGPQAHRRYWGIATTSFAAAQAAAGLGMSAYYDAQGHYMPLFLLGSLVLMAATLLVLTSKVAFPIYTITPETARRQ